jgi:hypothetical protein
MFFRTFHLVIFAALVALDAVGCQEEVRPKHAYLRSQNEYQANDPARAEMLKQSQGDGFDQFTKSLDDFFFGWAKDSPQPPSQPPSARTGFNGPIGGGPSRTPNPPGAGPNTESR